MSQRDARKWMWSEAVQLLQEADRLHRQFFQVGGRQLTAPAWEPPLDVFDMGEMLALYFALPGINAHELEVGVEGAMLIVRGERPLPPEAHIGQIRRLEIPYGRFERRVVLPSGRYELVRHQLGNGCLVIHLQRNE